MKKLVFTALITGALSQAAGCIIVSDDDDNGNGGVDTAQFGVAWSLEGGCPAGATTIQVVMDDRSGAAPYEDLYDCVADGAGDTAPRPLGTYDVWINVTDDAGAAFASSFAVEVTLDSPGTVVEVPEFAFPTDGGFMTLTWDVLDDATDEQLECADVGAEGVALTATFVDSTDFVDFEWDCTLFEGITDKMALDTYTVVVSVVDGDGLSLGDSMAREESITYGNEHVDLGNFDFAFAQ